MYSFYFPNSLLLILQLPISLTQKLHSK